MSVIDKAYEYTRKSDIPPSAPDEYANEGA